MDTTRKHNYEANCTSSPFRPGDCYVRADLEDADAIPFYGEVVSVESEDTPRRSWFTVREYWEGCPPDGECDERSLTPTSHEVLIKLTPEEGARVRQLGWPNLLRPLIEAYAAQAEWLGANGFDGYVMLGDGRLCEEDKAPLSVLCEQRAKALQQRIHQSLSQCGGVVQ
jgi:hypothetical protein